MTPTELADGLQKIVDKGSQGYARALNHHDISLLLEAIAALRSPPAGFKDVVRDAERYRWLRDEARTVDWTHWCSPSVYSGCNKRTAEQMDNAIDAAIAAAPREESAK